MFLDFFEPVDAVLEWLASGDVINEQTADGSSIVRASYWSKRFLACCVPNLQLHIDFGLDSYEPGAELDADSEVMWNFESFVGELEEQARFTDTGVADNNILERVSKRHLFD